MLDHVEDRPKHPQDSGWSSENPTHSGLIKEIYFAQMNFKILMTFDIYFFLNASNDFFMIVHPLQVSFNTYLVIEVSFK